MDNYYNLFEIDPDASIELIKIKYRRLSIRYHPDRAEGGDIETFIKIQRAYEVLSGQRAWYDSQPGIAEWIGEWKAKKEAEKKKEDDLQKAKDLEIEGLKKKIEELTDENEKLKIEKEFVLV
jgi:curved DNA-binding protein CbpA